MTPFQQDLSFQFKAGAVHRVVEASKAPIKPCNVGKDYMQRRHAEVHLENQNASQNMCSHALPWQTPQTSEHGNKKNENNEINP